MSGTNGTNGSTHDALAAKHLTWADPESIELEAEQNRLRSELAEASARLQAAKDRVLERDEMLHRALREELSTAQQAMTDREAAHRAALEAIRTEALLEAQRILEQATHGPIDDAPTQVEQVEHGQ
ncbi:MAG: hypothetical protein HY828_15605 [Actinobacteria bacterium]|nr:hypothetical protein [Actinomycetota bacterium]